MTERSGRGTSVVVQTWYCSRSELIPTCKVSTGQSYEAEYVDRRSELARPKCELLPSMIAGLITETLVYHSKDLMCSVGKFSGSK